MQWADVFVSFFIVGMVIDIVSGVLIVGYEFGFSDRRAYPIGPVFYILGFLQLVLLNKRPLDSSLLLFAGCLVFYGLVIFSGVILRKITRQINRVRAYSRQLFEGDDHSEISNQQAVRMALSYVSPPANTIKRGDSGLIYISSSNSMFKTAIFRVTRSGECVVDVAEDDPGHVKSGLFARNFEIFGFPMSNWRITPRRQFIIPMEDWGRIPSFIDVLFRKYYGCGDTFQLRVEAMKLRHAKT